MNLPYSFKSVVRKVSTLNTYQRGERRAPHKPLLLLLAIGALTRGRKQLTFQEVESQLTPLLNAFAPPVLGSHQPELPYWYLRSDGLWIVDGASQMPRQAGGFPRMSALRSSMGHLSHDISELVSTNPEATGLIVDLILEEHFPPSVHEDIIAAVGLVRSSSGQVSDGGELLVLVRNRSPRFREDVLRAYEYRCAVTGFRAALGGTYFGCEAAHVRWHAYDGPDDVSNGIALEPTIHKLFDAGAWSLTDDRRILVSREFTGSDTAVRLLRELHGKPLQDPLPGESPVSIEHIHWHRERDLGGVFRTPGLPLE